MIDRMLFAMSVAVVNQIHLVIEFNDRLDLDRINRALRLVLDAEPILGCRFVPRFISPYWLHLLPSDLDAFELLRVSTGNASDNNKTVERFLAEPSDVEAGPLVKALVVNQDAGDKLILKVHHMAADAGGVKDLGSLLAEIYRRIENEPGFIPEINLGSRSSRQVYRRLLPRHAFGILRSYLREAKAGMWPMKSLVFTSGVEQTSGPHFVTKHFSSDRVKALNSYGARREATINDLLVTAVLRALARHLEWDGKRTLRLACTADQRRYLPGGRAEAICNLSCFLIVSLGNSLGRDFDQTLTAVKRQIDFLKSDYIGLGFNFASYLQNIPIPFVLMRFLFANWMTFLMKGEIAATGFTNMGAIEARALDFDAPDVTAAYLLVPPSIPSFWAAGLSGWKDTLTLSAGIFEPAFSRTDMESLFDLVDRELPG